MDVHAPLDPEQLFAGEPGAADAYRAVRGIITAIGPAEVRTTRSQVAFRRRRGFAYLGALADLDAEVEDWLREAWAGAG